MPKRPPLGVHSCHSAATCTTAERRIRAPPSTTAPLDRATPLTQHAKRHLLLLLKQREIQPGRKALRGLRLCGGGVHGPLYLLQPVQFGGPQGDEGVGGVLPVVPVFVGDVPQVLKIGVDGLHLRRHVRPMCVGVGTPAGGRVPCLWPTEGGGSRNSTPPPPLSLSAQKSQRIGGRMSPQNRLPVTWTSVPGPKYPFPLVVQRLRVMRRPSIPPPPREPESTSLPPPRLIKCRRIPETPAKSATFGRPFFGGGGWLYQ